MSSVSIAPRFLRGFFISNSRSHPCPLFVQLAAPRPHSIRTASPCVVSPLPTAANAALPAPLIIPTSAPTTLAKTPKPAPPINSPANYPISSPANTFPPAISAPPSDVSCLPSSAATLSPAPPALSPISPKLSPKPSILPSRNTSTPPPPTAGSGPSAIPSARTSITATPPRHPHPIRIRFPNHPQPHNRPHRRTLPPSQLPNRSRRRTLLCLRLAPTSLSVSWTILQIGEESSHP